MTTSGTDAARAGGSSPLLSRAGMVLLFAGCAARFLMGDDLEPLAEALAEGLLLLGGGLLLALGVQEGRAVVSPWTVLVIALMVPSLWPLESFTLKRGADAFAAVVAGLALREVVHRPLGASVVWRALVAAAVLLSTFGIAQTGWLRTDARALAEASGHALVLSERGRAFLDSWRASATFSSPNHFGGFLLLIVPAMVAGFRSRRSVAAALALLLALAGFACAGSAGAVAAALLAIPFVVWRQEAPGSRLRSAGAVVFWVALGGAAVVAALAGAQVGGGKLATLAERFDYHRIAARLLPDHFLAGAGLEATRAWMESVARPGESFSRSPHDWWLQGLIEAGVAFVTAATLILAAVVRAMRRPGDAADGAAIGRPAIHVRSAGWALIGGTLIAALIHPFVTFLPSTVGLGAVGEALLTVVVAAGAWYLAGEIGIDRPAVRSGLAAGLVAFLVHGFLDADLFQPGVMLAFAMVLALVAPRPRAIATRLDRVAALLLIVAAILAPLPLVKLSAARGALPALSSRAAQGEPADDETRAEWEAAARGPVPDLRAASLIWPELLRAGAFDRAAAIVDSWGAGLRRRPDARKLIDALAAARR